MATHKLLRNLGNRKAGTIIDVDGPHANTLVRSGHIADPNASTGDSGDDSNGDALSSLTREQLDDKARELGVDDPEKLANKGEVMDAITAAGNGGD